MDPFQVSLIVFAFAFGGALIGFWLHGKLPAHHRDDASKDAVKIGIGLIATMTALVLGLVTASAKSTFDAVDNSVKHTAMDVLALDRFLSRYGPETKDIRSHLQQLVANRIEALWPNQSVETTENPSVPSGPSFAGEKLADAIQALQPRDDVQRSLQTRALDLAENVLQARWMVFAGVGRSVPFLFLLILTFWLTITFISFGLFAPRNGTVFMVLFVCAASVGSAMFLILELDSPFQGYLKVSAEPLQYAHSFLNQ